MVGMDRSWKPAVNHRVLWLHLEAPVRVDHYRNGPYDMLLTLSGGRIIGVIRQGPALPTSRLRYRLRSIERLDSNETPFVTLVLAHADQATRRAVRSLGDPSEHRRTFVATEGEPSGRRPHRSRMAAMRERPGRGPCASTPTRPWRASWPWRSACWTRPIPSSGTDPNRIPAPSITPARRLPCRNPLSNSALPSRRS